VAKSTNFEAPYWVVLYSLPLRSIYSSQHPVFKHPAISKRSGYLQRTWFKSICRTAAAAVLTPSKEGLCMLLHCTEGRSTSQWWRGQGPTTFPLALAVRTEDTSSGIDVIQARLINKQLHRTEGWSTIVCLLQSYLEHCFGSIGYVA
jgi:hypothetical protein